MKSSSELAKRFREVVFNGTWIAGTNLKDQLSWVSLEEATHQTGQLNTIAALTFHIGYYIGGVKQVLEGGTLDIRDKYSFDLPPLHTEQDWENLRNRLWEDSEKFAGLVEQMTEEKLGEDFTDKRYGSYQRNIEAMIEHAYYHLGQIVLLRKLKK